MSDLNKYIDKRINHYIDYGKDDNIIINIGDYKIHIYKKPKDKKRIVILDKMLRDIDVQHQTKIFGDHCVKKIISTDITNIELKENIGLLVELLNDYTKKEKAKC